MVFVGHELPIAIGILVLGLIVKALYVLQWCLIGQEPLLLKVITVVQDVLDILVETRLGAVTSVYCHLANRSSL